MFTRGESPPKSSILWFVYGRPFCWLQLSPLPDVTPKRMMVTKEHPATKDATISLIWCDWSSCDCRNRGALLAVEDLSPLVLMNKGEHRFLEEENQYIHTNIFIQRHQHIYILLYMKFIYVHIQQSLENISLGQSNPTSRRLPGGGDLRWRGLEVADWRRLSEEAKLEATNQPMKNPIDGYR